jgi:hypothetical protein
MISQPRVLDQAHSKFKNRHYAQKQKRQVKTVKVCRLTLEEEKEDRNVGMFKSLFNVSMYQKKSLSVKEGASDDNNNNKLLMTTYHRKTVSRLFELANPWITSTSMLEKAIVE